MTQNGIKNLYQIDRHLSDAWYCAAVTSSDVKLYNVQFVYNSVMLSSFVYYCVMVHGSQ